MKKRSLPLVFALVASTSMIVNCQKTPSKRSATTTNGNVGSVEAANSSAKLALDLKITKDCPIEIKNLRKDLLASMTAFNSKYMNQKVSDLTEAQKAELGDESQKIVDSCRNILEKLKSVNEAGCKDTENTQNPLLVKEKVQIDCEVNGNYLKKLSGQENELSKKYQQRETGKGQERAIEKLKTETLVLSKEGRSMMLSGGILWKSYLDMGEVKSSQTELEKLVKDNKTVCSFDTEMKLEDNQSAEFQLNLIENNKKNDSGTYEKEVVENYDNLNLKGNKASVVLTFSRINADDKNGDLNNLVCVNAKKEEMTAQKIKQILGKVLVQKNEKEQDISQKKQPDQKAKETESKVVTTSKTTSASDSKKSSKTSDDDAKTKSEPLTVVSIRGEGLNYQIISLSSGEDVKIEKDKMKYLEQPKSGQSGSIVSIEMKDGKRYLFSRAGGVESSTLIIENTSVSTEASQTSVNKDDKPEASGSSSKSEKVKKTEKADKADKADKAVTKTDVQDKQVNIPADSKANVTANSTSTKTTGSVNAENLSDQEIAQLAQKSAQEHNTNDIGKIVKGSQSLYDKVLNSEIRIIDVKYEQRNTTGEATVTLSDQSTWLVTSKPENFSKILVKKSRLELVRRTWYTTDLKYKGQVTHYLSAPDLGITFEIKKLSK